MDEYLYEVNSLEPADSDEADYQRRYRKLKANRKKKRRKELDSGSKQKNILCPGSGSK